MIQYNIKRVKGSSSTVGRDERGIWGCSAAQRRAAKAPRAVTATAAPLKWSEEAPLKSPALAAPRTVGVGDSLEVGDGEVGGLEDLRERVSKRRIQERERY